MTFLRIFSTITVLVSTLASANAAVWRIKPDGTGDASTVQDGIIAASPGDTVRLAPGTYTGLGNRDIDFMVKAIVVDSEGGAEVTIIDCQELGRGFIFQNLEGPSSVLSGITIKNGNSGYDVGGGIKLVGSPTISNMILVDNRSGFHGGGIFCGEGSPLIKNSVFRQNYAEGHGGGICCLSSNATIEGNTFMGNRAPVGAAGGGVYCAFGSPSISNNTFCENEGVEGGGLLYEASGIISGNVFIGNNAWFGGGALCGGSLVFTNNIVKGNTAIDGGGLLCGDGEFSYNVISGNTANNRGGGIYSEMVSPNITNNTVCENSAPSGGGMYFYMSGSPVIEYNIIAFNTQGTGIGCSGAFPIVSCCDIFENAGGDVICGIDAGNNISVDPQFCGIVGSGNYSLQADSPCLGHHDLPCGDQYMGALPAECGTVSVENKTWGAIKALYRD